MTEIKQQPLCRYCGGKIAKRTVSIRFGHKENRISSFGFWVERTERPTTKEQAQAITNYKIVSIRWWTEADTGLRHISNASAWDGESYVDEFFCNGDHAKRFAYVMARAGHATKVWMDTGGKAA
jgi:hypothetical protein